MSLGKKEVLFSVQLFEVIPGNFPSLLLFPILRGVCQKDLHLFFGI